MTTRQKNKTRDDIMGRAGELVQNGLGWNEPGRAGMTPTKMKHLFVQYQKDLYRIHRNNNNYKTIELQ